MINVNATKVLKIDKLYIFVIFTLIIELDNT